MKSAGQVISGSCGCVQRATVSRSTWVNTKSAIFGLAKIVVMLDLVRQATHAHLGEPESDRLHIGGVMPSRPTEMVGASSVPSSFLLAAAMKILAPGLTSLLSPGT
jgi:hypothetical protein